MKISGYTVVRNGILLDYCFEECIRSLLDVCDEVVVCDSESTDDTLFKLHSMAEVYGKLRIINYPWPSPVNDRDWIIKWMNHARRFLTHPMQLYLDADEVLCPWSHPLILRAAEKQHSLWFHRLNFWKDPQHIAPHGTVCGEQVVRFGPSNLWMTADEPHPEGEPEIRKRAGWPPNADATARIFHYGFLRRPEAFFRKSRVVQGGLVGTYDSRLERSEREGLDWVKECPFTKPLLDYAGDHPEVARRWLTERGYTV